MLITHCIWTLEENIDEVKKIVEKSIERFSQISRKDFENLSNEVNTLKKDIESECINDKNVYDTEDIKGMECIKISLDYHTNYGGKAKIYLYVPLDKLDTASSFYALDKNGNEYEYFSFSFNGGSSLKITKNSAYYLIDSRNNYVNEISKNLPLKTKKGTYKEITSRTKENYIKSCNELIEKIDDAVKKSEEDLIKQKEKIDSPFVAECYRDIILKSYNDYIADFKSKKLEVEQEKNKVEQCQTINN